MAVFINTCVFPTGKLGRIKEYVERFGTDVAFEIHSKFDEASFASELEDSLDYMKTKGARIAFHGPVWEAEHSAARGTKEYDRAMELNRLTAEYACRYGAEHVVYHLNNCEIPEGKRDEMQKNSLENLERIRELYRGIPVYVENTGTAVMKNVLLDQAEFTELCRRKQFDVLIDIGHAHANGWDLYRLAEDLKGQIREFHIHNNDGVHDLHNRLHDGSFDVNAYLKFILKTVPEAKWTVEYVRGEYMGEPLAEDLAEVLSYQKQS